MDNRRSFTIDDRLSLIGLELWILELFGDLNKFCENGLAVFHAGDNFGLVLNWAGGVFYDEGFHFLDLFRHCASLLFKFVVARVDVVSELLVLGSL